MAEIAKLPDEAHWPIKLPLADRHAKILLARLGQPVWFYDFDRHAVRWANAAGLDLWNAGSLEELQDRDFSPVSRGTVERLDNLRSRLVMGETVTESWTLYPFGRPKQVDCRFSGIRFVDDNIGMMVEAPIVRGEDQTVAAELRAVEAIRQTSLMVSLATVSGQWLMHNPAAEALMRRLALVNLPGLDNFLAPFADREAAAALRLRAIDEGSAEETLRMTGRGFRMHEVNLRRAQDPVTGQLSLILTQQDVTHAFRLERSLQKALERERTVAETQRQFLSLTSHEFRTPLSVIDGSARRIEKIARDQDNQIVERVRTIRAAVRRMSNAVDSTLATASIAEGKFAFHPVRAELPPIIEHVVATQRTLHPERRIDVDIPHLSQLMIDPAIVEQVLENLLSNAIKYSPAETPIEIRCSLQAEAILITITDHGIGIPAEDMPKLFSRFFRSSNARSVKGTGVGLHAVRFFMDLHGGKVAIKSREGEGSTVTLTFPLPAA